MVSDYSRIWERSAVLVISSETARHFEQEHLCFQFAFFRSSRDPSIVAFFPGEESGKSVALAQRKFVLVVASFMWA